LKNFISELNTQLEKTVPSNAKLIWELPGISYFETDKQHRFNPNLTFGVLLDFEATGKDPKIDLPVEIGGIKFAFDSASGEILGVESYYGGLEDPGIPISPEASAVNGITDEMVKGHNFDPAKTRELFEDVELVIAHNAMYDRILGERRFEFLKDLSWACSFKDIDWSKDFLSSSAKLEYLAFKAGFYYSAHRAVSDCLATLAVLDYLKSQNGDSAFNLLWKASKKSKYRIWATGAPFAVKNLLSDAGYKWSNGDQEGSEKAWFKFVAEEDLDNQLKWLKSEIFSNKPVVIRVDKISSKNAFSDRIDEKLRIPL